MHASHRKLIRHIRSDLKNDSCCAHFTASSCSTCVLVKSRWHTTEQYSLIADRNGAIGPWPAHSTSTVLRNTVVRKLVHKFCQCVCSTSYHLWRGYPTVQSLLHVQLMLMRYDMPMLSSHSKLGAKKLLQCLILGVGKRSTYIKFLTQQKPLMGTSNAGFIF